MQVGQNSRIEHCVVIGDGDVMGPDVVIMTIGHVYDDPNCIISYQGVTERVPVLIGRDVWIGTVVNILTRVIIGEGAVIGADAVLAKSVAPYSVVAGVPASVVKWRKNFVK